MFRAANPPSNLLCDRVLILGISVETLKRNSHAELLIKELTESPPEVIAAFPKWEEDADKCESIRSVVFPGNAIRMLKEPRAPAYEAHSLAIAGSRMRVHCIKVWESVDPAVANESSTVSIPWISKPSSFKSSEGKKKSELEPAYYAPIAFCVLTKTKYFASLRALLEQLFVHVGVLRRDPRFGPAVGNAEFTRLMCFLLNDVFVPAKCTRLCVQVGETPVHFPVDYLKEPIHNEQCMQMLLDLLDVDILVTLWQLVLVEKNVVVMGRLNNIIYGVLEGLKILMFPLKWVLTYIPLLDRNPLELIAENKTLLAGVNTGVLEFSEVAVKPFEGAVYNLDTGELYLQPKTYDTICPLELGHLKKALLGLKAYRHHFDEHARVLSNCRKCEEWRSVERWRYLSAASDELQPDLLISEMREAFLRPLIDNLRNYNSCLMLGLKKDSLGFNVTSFTQKLPRCSIQNCNSVNFWIALVHTMSFQQLMDEDHAWDESNADVFRSLVEAKRNSGQIDILWYLREQRSRHPVFDLSQRPLLAPRELFERLDHILSLKTPSSDPKFNTFLANGRQHIASMTSALSEHPYFSEDYRECLLDAEDDAAVPHRLWYGTSGLLRHLLLTFECFDIADFKELNTNSRMLESLQDDAWQALIMKAYLQEALGLDAALIVKSYRLAFQQNGGWVPFHRFSKVLEMLSVPDAQEALAGLELSEGLMQRIVRNVMRKLKENDERVRSARSSIEPSADFAAELLPIVRKPESEKPRLGIMKKAKRIAAVMGAMRESIGAVELRTTPLNERPPSSAPPRDGVALVEGLLLSLRKILMKYKSKVENGKIKKLFHLLDSDPEFRQMSHSIGDLQNIRLTPTSLQHPLHALCMYLNLHNFIVLYAVLAKKQLCNNAIEWNKFLSCLCFIVGGERMTPILIQSVLLRAAFNPAATELAPFNPMDQSPDHPLSKYQLPMLFPCVHFGIYIPAAFCGELRVYTAKTVEKQLEQQAKAFCRSVAVDELRRTVTLPALFYIKDFGSDADMLRLLRKVLKGEDTGKQLKKLVKTEAREVEKLHTVEDWRFSLRKVLAEDVNDAQESH